MAQRSGYNQRIFSMIEKHYGTVKEFARDNSISEPTAYKYMKSPGSMSITFVRQLARKMNVEACEIVGEGVE